MPKIETLTEAIAETVANSIKASASIDMARRKALVDDPADANEIAEDLGDTAKSIQRSAQKLINSVANLIPKG